MFEAHVKKKLGMAPHLMMPGNYARQLFLEKNATVVLELIEDVSRRETLRLILDKFRFVRKLYRSTEPHLSFPNEIKELKRTAVEIDNFLFGYAH